MDPYLDDAPAPTSRLSSLRATPAELVGLSVLLVGALVATGVFWWGAARRPELAPSALGAAASGEHEATTGSDTDHWSQAPGAGPTGPDGPMGPHDPAVAPKSVLPELGPAEVTVHVSGAIATPGVVTLRAGARVADAVDAAGGLGADAELARINLARTLADGEHVHVPRVGEEPLGAPPSAGAAPDQPGAVDTTGRLDLNRATAEELQRLPGIGPSRSAAIVRHREEHGPFRVPGDLRAVPGIGEATFQGLADLVVVG
jgi:competence protein ComEA